MSELGNMSLALVSRNALGREGLRRIIDGGAFTVTQSVACSEALADAPAEWAPGIIIFDETDSRLIPSAVERLRSRFPGSKIVLLVDEFDFEAMIEAFQSGAVGYIVKTMECEALIGSLRLIATGEKVMPSQLLEHLPGRIETVQAQPANTSDWRNLLSDREIETMHYLLTGCSNKVIAHGLNISEATVKVHIKAILRKLGVQNRTQAALWAVNNRIDLAASAPARGETDAPERLTA